MARQRRPVLNDFVWTLALTCVLSPGERISPVMLSVGVDDWPTNPALGYSKDAGNVSPSPWGEGRDEGGRQTNFWWL
jgi:hypothetical protein